MSDEKYMSLAIKKAREGIELGQSPFAACLVRDGEIIACDHNHVWLDTDITAHAEIIVLRNACLKMKSIDLSRSIIYSTTEPCPMCFSALHWARVSKIFFGAGISDAYKAGFNELTLSNADLKKHGGSTIEIIPGYKEDECVALFDLWNGKKLSKPY